MWRVQLLAASLYFSFDAMPSMSCCLLLQLYSCDSSPSSDSEDEGIGKKDKKKKLKKKKKKKVRQYYYHHGCCCYISTLLPFKTTINY